MSAWTHGRPAWLREPRTDDLGSAGTACQERCLFVPVAPMLDGQYPASRLSFMEERASWLARAWLPYFLAGVAWVMVGAVVLGVPRGLGLIFVGLACLSLGVRGAGWRLRHGYGLVGPPR